MSTYIAGAATEIEANECNLVFYYKVDDEEWQRGSIPMAKILEYMQENNNG